MQYFTIPVESDRTQSPEMFWWCWEVAAVSESLPGSDEVDPVVHDDWTELMVGPTEAVCERVNVAGRRWLTGADGSHQWRAERVRQVVVYGRCRADVDVVETRTTSESVQVRGSWRRRWVSHIIAVFQWLRHGFSGSSGGLDGGRAVTTG